MVRRHVAITAITEGRRKPLFAVLISLITLLCAHLASAQTCRQALVLGLDVSLSVDTKDFRLQREGLARALLDEDVVQAMTRGAPGHVELAIFEWSGRFDQRILIDWTIIEDRTTLETVALILRRGEQTMRSGRTAIGASMLFARDLLRDRANCAIRTFDISGDGMNNNGPLPEEVKASLARDGIIVNALVIGLNQGDVFFGEPDIEALSSYYRDRVIVGQRAFVETVLGFEGYFEAIRLKLIRELLPAFVEITPPRRITLTQN